MFTYKQELYRKLIHLSSIFYPIIYVFLNQNTMVIILSVLFCVVAVWDILRVKGLELKFLNFLKNTLRQSELQNKKFSGAFFFMLSSLICVLLFNKNIAIISILVLVVGDTSAALIGKKLGGKIFKKTTLFKNLNKSLEGLTAFIVSSYIAVYIFNYFYNFNISCVNIVFAICVASLFELFAKKTKIDDNLLISFVCGLSLAVLNLGY